LKNDFSDMTINIWDVGKENPLVNRMEHHTEFVVGLDWNMFIEGQIGSASWDETVTLFDMRDNLKPLPPPR